MSVERHASLSQWAREIGIDRGMLKRALIVKLGYRFPVVARGSKHLIPQSAIEAVLRLMAPKQDWTLLRTQHRKAG